MGKTIQEKIDSRFEEISRLKKEIDEKQRRLIELMGLNNKSQSNKQANPLPEGVTLMQAIMAVFNDSPSKLLQIKDVIRGIEKKYSTNAERKTVQSTLQYLDKNKKLLEKVANQRGVYRLKESS